MGQKVNPHGLRVGVNKEWSSSWIASKKEFSDYIVEDNKIRKFITKKHAGNGIAKIVIERTVNRLTVDIYTSKPGIVIGMKGAGVEELKNDIAKLSNNKSISINIKHCSIYLSWCSKIFSIRNTSRAYSNYLILSCL